MSKNQSKPETDDNDPWLGEDLPDFGDQASEQVATPRSRLETRHKIEDLIEQRRLKRQLGDYESFDLDGERPRRLH